MAAATSDQCRTPWSLPESAPVEVHTIKQAQTIYQGSLAMALNTDGKATPLVAATANTVLLGVALRQYSAPAGADRVLPEGAPAIFLRGVYPWPGLAGDLPTEAQINQTVYFADNQTVQKTAPGAPNLGGILRAITEGQYWVEI